MTKEQEYQLAHDICDELDDAIRSLQQAKFTLWNRYAREHAPHLAYASIEDMLEEERVRPAH
jgi:hypothetical protein